MHQCTAPCPNKPQHHITTQSSFSYWVQQTIVHVGITFHQWSLSTRCKIRSIVRQCFGSRQQIGRRKQGVHDVVRRSFKRSKRGILGQVICIHLHFEDFRLFFGFAAAIVFFWFGERLRCFIDQF